MSASLQVKTVFGVGARRGLGLLDGLKQVGRAAITVLGMTYFLDPTYFCRNSPLDADLPVSIS